jgi:hydrogenase maturation protein HypF
VLVACAREGLATVALGGGCFVNAILSTGLARELACGGLTVLEARQAPANDGGIALGQAWAALQEIA